jgi:hypothetical protein
MTTTPRDKGQRYSGQGNAANRVTPRKNGPPGGGTVDQGEGVVFERPVDQDGDPKVLTARTGSTADFASSYSDRRIGVPENQPYTRPRDTPNHSTTPIPMYSDDSADVGVSSGQYFGSSGQLGPGEEDWRTPEVRGDSQGPSAEETVGRMPGLRNTSGTIKTIRRWQDFIPTPGRNDRE